MRSTGHSILFYKDPKVSEFQLPVEDIYLFLDKNHFTLLEPLDSKMTIDTLISEDATEGKEKKIQICLIDSDLCISTSVLDEALICGTDMALVEGDNVTLSEADSNAIFKNRATNGKNYPHLYMMSTFSHLLYNIKAIFAREITGM
jgi:hypothetical protein